MNFITGILPANVATNSKQLVFQSIFTTVATQTTFAFSNVTIGTTQSDRHVIINVHGGGSISSATCTASFNYGNGTTAMTNVTSIFLAARTMAQFIFNATTGNTTANFSITFSGTKADASLGTWWSQGLSSTTPQGVSATSANTGVISATVNSVSGGFAVGGTVGSVGSPTCTWNGLTKEYDTLTSALGNSGADTTSILSSTIIATATLSTTVGVVMVLSSW